MSTADEALNEAVAQMYRQPGRAQTMAIIAIAAYLSEIRDHLLHPPMTVKVHSSDYDSGVTPTAVADALREFGRRDGAA